MLGRHCKFCVLRAGRGAYTVPDGPDEGPCVAGGAGGSGGGDFCDPPVRAQTHSSTSPGYLAATLSSRRVAGVGLRLPCLVENVFKCLDL